MQICGHARHPIVGIVENVLEVGIGDGGATGDVGGHVDDIADAYVGAPVPGVA